MDIVSSYILHRLADMPGALLVLASRIRLDHARLPVDLLEVDGGPAREAGDGGGQLLRVRGETDLRSLPSARDEVGQRFKEIGVQAGFGLVEREERWWSWAEQRR